MFTNEKARAKLGRAYPKPVAKSDRVQRVKTSVTGTSGSFEIGFLIRQSHAAAVYCLFA
jgi:hypothetical protein